jgi:predicted PurR-regulated permease PerM
LGSVFGSFLAGLTILVLTYFMLIEGPDLIERAWAYHPNPSKERNQKLAVKMYGSVTGYVLGNVLTSVICFVATWLFLTIAGLPYALPIALLVGLLDLVPMVGASLGAILAILVALTQSFYLGLGTLVFFLVYQQVENNFLQPYVYGRTVQISPLAVFISALLGVALGGLLGALVAVPIGASIAIVLREVLPSRRVKNTLIASMTSSLILG